MFCFYKCNSIETSNWLAGCGWKDFQSCFKKNTVFQKQVDTPSFDKAQMTDELNSFVWSHSTKHQSAEKFANIWTNVKITDRWEEDKSYRAFLKWNTKYVIYFRGLSLVINAALWKKNNSLTSRPNQIITNKAFELEDRSHALTYK